MITIKATVTATRRSISFIHATTSKVNTYLNEEIYYVRPGLHNIIIVNCDAIYQ